MTELSKEEHAINSIKRGLEFHEVSQARKIAIGIYADVLDRKGIKHEFAECDAEVIQEILSAWEEIAQVVINGKC